MLRASIHRGDGYTEKKAHYYITATSQQHTRHTHKTHTQTHRQRQHLVEDDEHELHNGLPRGRVRDRVLHLGEPDVTVAASGAEQLPLEPVAVVRVHHTSHVGEFHVRVAVRLVFLTPDIKCITGCEANTDRIGSDRTDGEGAQREKRRGVRWSVCV